MARLADGTEPEETSQEKSAREKRLERWGKIAKWVGEEVARRVTLPADYTQTMARPLYEHEGILRLRVNVLAECRTAKAERLAIAQHAIVSSFFVLADGGNGKIVRCDPLITRRAAA